MDQAFGISVRWIDGGHRADAFTRNDSPSGLKMFGELVSH